jgi:valyl-tRNA synthetase
MPYISEELWHALPGTDGDVCVAPWPVASRGASNPAAEEQVALLRDVVGAIRNLRSEMNIPPARQVSVRIRAEADDASSLQAMRDLIQLLARVDGLEIGTDVKKPEVASSAVVGRSEIFLPLTGLIDLDAEVKRLQKEYERVAREFDLSHRKLQNEDFLGKAKKDVVDRERGKLEALGVTKEKLERNLEVLRR